MSRHAILERRRQAIYGWLFLSPAAILLTIFAFYPSIATLWSSAFSRGTRRKPSEFVANENYMDLFADPIFWQVVKNNLFYAGNAAANKSVAKIKYQEATTRLQNEGIISGVYSQSGQVFVNNKSGLGGIGKLQIVKGKTQRVVTNWGFDWTGIYKK